MPNEKDAEIKSRYDDYSVEELRAALDAIFDSTDEFSDSDVEKMDEIIAVLDKKDPLTQRYTAEESLKHFREYYREELSRLGVRNTEEVIEKEPEEVEAPANAVVVRPKLCCAGKTHHASANAEDKPCCCRKLFHTALIAAATVAVMVIVTVSAAAAGVDIWKWVPVRGNGTFQLVSEETVSSTSMDIPSALKQLGIEDPMFPTWLPDGFVLYDQQIHMEDPIILYASYVHKDRTIIITISGMTDRSKTGNNEMDDVNPVEYDKSDITHYIFTNLGSVVATWYIDDYLVRISGNLTVEELEKTIDSIYEVLE